MESMDLHEREALANGNSVVAGIDEAGRGPLAGPVVAAAVVFSPSLLELPIRDSKRLSPVQREYLFEEIYRRAVSIGIGVVDREDIDRYNILRASLVAMEMAVSMLTTTPDILLIDGNRGIDTRIPQRTIIKGDACSVTIAAASIVAKVTRDRIMDAYHRILPEYGFNRHKGYPTREHIEAIRRFGPSGLHRMTFKGVREHLEGQKEETWQQG